MYISRNRSSHILTKISLSLSHSVLEWYRTSKNEENFGRFVFYYLRAMMRFTMRWWLMLLLCVCVCERECVCVMFLSFDDDDDG